MSNEIIHLLNTAVFICFAAGLVALPFFAVNMVRAAWSARRIGNQGLQLAQFPVKSALFFIVPIILVMIFSAIIGDEARSEAITFLSALPPTYTVYINGQPSRSPEPIVAALRSVGSRMAHHSHPTHSIRVDVQTGSGVLNLVLGRDSQNRQEYWVFYPKYKVSANNEIGRIVSAAFDEY